MAYLSLATELILRPIRLSTMYMPCSFIQTVLLPKPRPSHRAKCRRPVLCVQEQPRKAVVTTPSTTQQPPRSPSEEVCIDAVLALATDWAEAASKVSRRDLVAGISTDSRSVAFVMKFVDLVMRPEDTSVAARLLRRLLETDSIPSFMGALDAILMRLGASFAELFPWPIVVAARLRTQAMVSGFVGTVEWMHFRGAVQWNVNLLGEAVLGEREALRRRMETEEMIGRKDVDYVSVKASAVTSQLNRWDFDGSLERVVFALRPLFERASVSHPRVLINLDMEEFYDLEITVAAFTKLLDEKKFKDLDAGIVLQTYLPDALPVLKKLVWWAHNRDGTSEIKIRLVKGANLAMERVDAVMNGWDQATYEEKVDTDANYLCCLDWVLTHDRTRRVRIGVATHNIFLLSYAANLAKSRGVTHRVGFENLKGMAPVHAQHLAKRKHGMLLYAPVCRISDFDVAISYLFRRFEEMTVEGNFLSSLPGMKPGSPGFMLEQSRFLAAVAKVGLTAVGPRRVQARPAVASAMTVKGMTGTSQFFNEPDTDPALPHNRTWALEALKKKIFPELPRRISLVSDMRRVLQQGRQAGLLWGIKASPADRRMKLSRIADLLARRRGDLINAMVREGRKTFPEADAEVSEAIDFAHYYGMMVDQLPNNFKPFGLVTVVAPWNFPVAISCGGIFSALAAGNSVILKPSSATSLCGHLVAKCAWEAGVPRDVLQVVRVEGHDVAKELITRSDAVILTGSSETAALFRSWKNDIRLFAETSGKNALIISPAADMDLAVSDLVASAFSNSGQRCSASSLAICIGEAYRSERFRRQLVDAVETVVVGEATDISTVMGPLIMPPGEKLQRALTQLDEGEKWLVKPRCLDAQGPGQIWSPGVRIGVKPGSWFHKTEVFGPVLGIMYARDLDEAIRLQNGTAYGLTGGIHSLDTTEIEHWTDKVEVGNAYVNRGITGALVQRQSFGGWKASVVGPGAKAGGPNYVAQLGIVHDETAARDEKWLSKAMRSDENEWESHFSREHDPTGLFCETNVFRYRSLPGIAVRLGRGSNKFEVARVRAAINRCGIPYVVWSSADQESAEFFASKLKGLGVARVRFLGEKETVVVQAAVDSNVHLSDAPVVANGRVELLHYVREQTISRTRHRFGNLVNGL